MSKELRKQIEKIIEELKNLKDICQERFDEKSERWQQSDVGDEALDEISSIEDAISNLQEI